MLTSEQPCQDYIIRKLTLTKMVMFILHIPYHADHTLSLTFATSQSNNESADVTQYHYLHWPEGGKSKGTASILRMCADLVKTQSHTGNKGITIMCK